MVNNMSIYNYLFFRYFTVYQYNISNLFIQVFFNFLYCRYHSINFARV